MNKRKSGRVKPDARGNHPHVFSPVPGMPPALARCACGKGPRAAIHQPVAEARGKRAPAVPASATAKQRSVLTARGMVAWVAKNVPQSCRVGQSPFRACLWFFAWQEALELRDYSTREMAGYCLNGAPGFKKMADLQNELACWEDEEAFIAEMYAFWKEGDANAEE